MRPRLLAFVFLAAAVASAEEPPAEFKPRPGQRWADQKPQGDVKEALLLLNKKEHKVYSVAPGGEIKAAVPGETRVLVRVRRDFGEQGAPGVAYRFTWKLGDGAETEVKAKASPSRKARYQGKPDAVPGTEDVVLIEIPGEAAQVVTIRLPGDAKAGVTVRFEVEEPAKLPGSSSSPKAHEDTWWMGTVTRLTFGYDDNVWRLSHNDRRSYRRDGDSDPNDRWDRMASIDDEYFDSYFDIHILSPTLPVGRFVIGATIDDLVYLQNHRKSVDSFGGYAGLKHDRFAIKAFGRFSPDHFWRNYDPQDVPGLQRAHAHYDDYELGGKLSLHPVKPFWASVTYTWELRDWNGSFNEKDTKANRIDLDLNFRAAKWLTLRAGYEFEVARALATGLEHDSSHLSQAPRIGADFEVWRILFGASYELEFRRYTTDHSSAEDPGYAGRRDLRHELHIYAGYKTGESSSLVIEYIRRQKRTNLPSNADASDEDSFDFESNAIELTFRFDWP